MRILFALSLGLLFFLPAGISYAQTCALKNAGDYVCDSAPNEKTSKQLRYPAPFNNYTGFFPPIGYADKDAIAGFVAIYGSGERIRQYMEAFGEPEKEEIRGLTVGVRQKYGF